MGRKKDVDKMAMSEVHKDLTPEELEFISKVKAGRKDPIYFANEILGVPLHDKQKLWLWLTTKTQTEKAYQLGLTLKIWTALEEFEKYKVFEFQKNILVPSNRWGKTLVTSVKHLWYNKYKVGVRGTPEHVAQERCGTLNLSPHSNQCDAGYQYIKDILENKFMWLDADGKSHTNKSLIGEGTVNPNGTFLVGENTQKRILRFLNGTTYKAVPTGEDQASSLAGTPYLYISYDECAQSLHLKNELPAKIMSRLIDYGGPLDLVSTPEVDKPSHQYFYHIAKLGLKLEDGWFTLVGMQDDNTFLSSIEKNRVLEQIRLIDPAKYRQVKYGEFVTTGKKMFDSLVIERIWDGFERPPVLHEHKYLLWADWGFADTGDPTIFNVIDYTEFVIKQRDGTPLPRPKYRIAFHEAIRGGSPFAVMARAKYLQREWNGAKFGHDAGSMGGVIIRKMVNEMDMHDIVDFSSAGGNKMEMLFILQVVLSEGRRVIIDAENKVTDQYADFGKLRSYHIPELEEQLGNYQFNPDKGVSDKKLEQDYVMTLGMALWWLEKKFNHSKVMNIAFNPLAPTVDKIFPEKSAQAIKMKTITIPETRIF